MIVGVRHLSSKRRVTNSARGGILCLTNSPSVARRHLHTARRDFPVENLTTVVPKEATTYHGNMIRGPVADGSNVTLCSVRDLPSGHKL